VRVLFTTQPGLGHLHPLIPLAAALRGAGHEVAFAAPASFGPRVRAAGFPHLPTGLDWDEGEIIAAFPALRAISSPAMQGRYVITYVFPYATARRTLPDLLALGEQWLPDLVVRETEEFAGCVAAERWGIPHVSVQAALTNTYTYRWALAAPLDALRDSVGLPSDPLVEMPYRYLHLAFLPPALHPPDEPLAPTARFLRPVPFDRSGDEELPDWVATLPDRPTVYATLGTVFNFARPIFDAILAALGDEPVNLILTVGRNVDPEAFGAQPGNVHIARYIPQTLILPRCDAVVAHGGINTVLAALLAGKPLVLLPQGSDHFSNAQQCEALGAGRTVAPGAQTPEAIREAVQAVLGEGGYREGAERARAEITALPGPEDAVALLERLAAEKQPQIAAT
jgi:MGT family glycosyltransferase